MNGETGNVNKILVQNPGGIDQFGGVYVYVYVKITFNLQKLDVKVLNRFNWLRIGSSDRLLLTGC
jgi:hypothetical protein